MIAEQILRELLHQTLKFAEINDDLEPQKTHSITNLRTCCRTMNLISMKWLKCCGPNKIEQANAVSEISKVFQKLNKLYPPSSIKFEE